MTLQMMVAEVQIVRQHVENSYYELLTLRKAIKAAAADGMKLDDGQINKTIDNVLARLERVVEQQ